MGGAVGDEVEVEKEEVECDTVQDGEHGEKVIRWRWVEDSIDGKGDGG